MCAISGWIRYGNSNYQTFKKFAKELASKSSVRGRDSFGITILDNFGGTRSYKHTDSNTNFETTENDFLAISNNRAEPTTEWVENKAAELVQPYSHNGIYAVHNGTIANDKDFGTDHKIDSEVIPVALSNGKFSTLIGSKAIAFFNGDAEINCANNEFSIEYGKLYLHKNYRPITLAHIPELQAYVFVSLKSTLTEVCTELEIEFCEIEFPQYSTICVGKSGVEFVQIESPNSKDSCIVVLSGGLDSTTSAKIACTKHKKVVLAHFHYGCRAEQKETIAVKAIYENLKLSHPDVELKLEFIDLSFIKNLGGNALTDHSLDVATGEAGAEFAHEWVPFRNGVMVSLIAAYCDRYNIGNIYTGANLEEAGAYGDNEEEFYIYFNKALQIGSSARPVIVNPLDKLMKHEIVKLAMDIGAPVHLSWSCYKGGDIHCGDCGPCYLRKKAFRMNSITDTLDYEV